VKGNQLSPLWAVAGFSGNQKASIIDTFTSKDAIVYSYTARNSLNYLDQRRKSRVRILLGSTSFAPRFM
jgi:hypothetical protein